MAETLWSRNRTCTCMYTLCLITVDFQASEQTKLRLRDETKWSDVTLGLWYMGLMRSASVGGACVSECEHGLQMAGQRRDLWMNGGEHVGQQTGREAGFLMTSWCLIVSHVYGRRFNGEEFCCLAHPSVYKHWMSQAGGLICPVCASLLKVFMNKGKEEALVRLSASRCLQRRYSGQYTIIFCFNPLIRRQSFQKLTSASDRELLVPQADKSHEHIWRMTDRIETHKKSLKSQRTFIKSASNLYLRQPNMFV